MKVRGEQVSLVGWHINRNSSSQGLIRGHELVLPNDMVENFRSVVILYL